MITISILALVSCSTDDILNDDNNSTNPTNSTGTNSSSSGSTPTTAGDLATFTIAVDSTDLSETETIPSDDEDYLENNSFTSTISIVYNGTSASYSGRRNGKFHG